VPGDRALLDLDERTRRALSIVPEDLLDLGHPAHVERLGEIDPRVRIRARCAHETTMFGAHAESANVAEVLQQEGRVATGDDPDDVFGIRGQLLESLKRCYSRNCGTWDLDNRRERALRIVSAKVHKR